MSRRTEKSIRIASYLAVAIMCGLLIWLVWTMSSSGSPSSSTTTAITSPSTTISAPQHGGGNFDVMAACRQSRDTGAADLEKEGVPRGYFFYSESNCQTESGMWFWAFPDANPASRFGNNFGDYPVPPDTGTATYEVTADHLSPSSLRHPVYTDALRATDLTAGMLICTKEGNRHLMGPMVFQSLAFKVYDYNHTGHVTGLVIMRVSYGGQVREISAEDLGLVPYNGLGLWSTARFVQC